MTFFPKRNICLRHSCKPKSIHWSRTRHGPFEPLPLSRARIPKQILLVECSRTFLPPSLPRCRVLRTSTAPRPSWRACPTSASRRRCSRRKASRAAAPSPSASPAPERASTSASTASSTTTCAAPFAGEPCAILPGLIRRRRRLLWGSRLRWGGGGLAGQVPQPDGRLHGQHHLHWLQAHLHGQVAGAGSGRGRAWLSPSLRRPFASVGLFLPSANARSRDLVCGGGRNLQYLRWLGGRMTSPVPYCPARPDAFRRRNSGPCPRRRYCP